MLLELVATWTVPVLWALLLIALLARAARWGRRVGGWALHCLTRGSTRRRPRLVPRGGAWAHLALVALTTPVAVELLADVVGSQAACGAPPVVQAVPRDGQDVDRDAAEQPAGALRWADGPPERPVFCVTGIVQDGSP